MITRNRIKKLAIEFSDGHAKSQSRLKIMFSVVISRPRLSSEQSKQTRFSL